MFEGVRKSLNINQYYGTDYESMKARAKIDLIAKKVAYTIIVSANLAALAGVYIYVTQYSMIPPTAVFHTSFFIGIVGSLNRLEVPTYGITPSNVFIIANPVIMIGQIASYTLLYPTLRLIEKMDFTDYSNPEVANAITYHLQESGFEFVAKHYGQHIGNLQRYGFITEEEANVMLYLYKEYQSTSAKLQKLKKFELIEPTSSHVSQKYGLSPQSNNPLIKQYEELKDHLKGVEGIWVDLQKDPKRTLPTPAIK